MTEYNSSGIIGCGSKPNLSGFVSGVVHLLGWWQCVLSSKNPNTHLSMFVEAHLDIEHAAKNVKSDDCIAAWKAFSADPRHIDFLYSLHACYEKELLSK